MPRSVRDKAKLIEKTLAKLGARKIRTQKAPVLFMPDEACGLIGLLIAAVSGGNLYRKSSSLLDSLGKKVFQDFIHIYEGAAHRFRL